MEAHEQSPELTPVEDTLPEVLADVIEHVVPPSTPYDGQSDADGAPVGRSSGSSE